MPTVYDRYDSDDTPPASPKFNFHKPARPGAKRVYSYYRRYKSLFVAALAFYAIYYYVKYYHHWLFPPTHAPSIRYKNVDWRLFAYSQYATDSHYLCNSVMVFEALDRLGSRAERILMYPEEWDTDIANITDRDSQLLVKAANWYGVKLIPVKVQKFVRDGAGAAREDELTWDTSLTKFLAFNQTQYLRIIHFDSDVTIQQHLDDLFLLPNAPVAMMRAYWAPVSSSLTSLFIMLKPSIIETTRLMAAAEAETRKNDEFDMEILDTLYSSSAMVIPHRGYGLLSGEFRSVDHTAYLGNDYEKWNPKRALQEAKMIHFSDWPIPKPWVMWPRELLQEKMPKCEYYPGTSSEQGCDNRDIWLELYNDFRRRRKDICGLLSVPAPEWPPRLRERPGTSSPTTS